MKKVKSKFSIVNTKWIVKQMTEKGLEVIDIAIGINSNSVQVYQWISGFRNPSKACKAALYYFFTFGYKEDKKNKKGA